VPAELGPLVAKLTVWGEDRELCLRRLQRSLEDFAIIGTPTNLPLLQRITRAPEFAAASCTTDFHVPLLGETTSENAEEHLPDLAAAAAILYMRHNQLVNPQASTRSQGG
jgi:acetyl/propionyl-CoA carboxylase alpha subunit